MQLEYIDFMEFAQQFRTGDGSGEVIYEVATDTRPGQNNTMSSTYTSISN